MRFHANSTASYTVAGPKECDTGVTTVTAFTHGQSHQRPALEPSRATRMTMVHGPELNESIPRRRSLRARKSDATLRSIEAIARQSFATSGFEGACVESIAETANVSRRTVYNRFGSKHGLYEAVCCGLFRELRAKIESRSNQTRGTTSRLNDQIWSIIAVLSDPNHDALVRLIIRDGETQPWLKLAYQEQLADPLWQGLQLALAAWAAEHGLQQIDVEAVCGQCRALLEGTITFSRLLNGSPPPPKVPAAQAVRGLLSTLASGGRLAA